MKLHRFGTLGVLAALAIAASAAPASATPVTVNLRIEGSNATVFEGPVTTDAKMITTSSSGGAHECDGTNNGAANTPGGTPTTALDDASIAHGFSWDGRYGNFGIDDFLVERIATDGTVGTFDPNGNFWDLLVNRAPAQVGGCQIRVNSGDTVLLEWQDGSHPNLQLSAPQTAQTGQAVPVSVQQYSDASGTLSPAAGVSVGGQFTDSSGNATLTFTTPGTQHLKATRADAIRSNAVDICVYAPGSGACGTSTPSSGVQGTIQDKLPPSVAVRGIRNHERFRHRHGPRILAGAATDAGGLFGSYFRLERRNGRGCQWYSSKRSVFTRARRGCKHARFQRVGTKPSWSYLLPARLPKGRYRLEEKAIDRSFNAARESVTFRVL
jgi:hypothetical protein